MRAAPARLRKQNDELVFAVEHENNCLEQPAACIEAQSTGDSSSRLSIQVGHDAA